MGEPLPGEGGANPSVIPQLGIIRIPPQGASSAGNLGSLLISVQEPPLPAGTPMGASHPLASMHFPRANTPFMDSSGLSLALRNHLIKKLTHLLPRR